MKYVENLLQEMSEAQKAPLVKILGLKEHSDEDVLKKLSKLLLPAKGLWQNPLNYRSFMEKIAIKNNEPFNTSNNIAEAEKQLYLELFQTEFDLLTEEEKEQIMKELEKAGLDRNQLGALGGISALGVAQLSGFGVYVLASSTVGAISSVLGITLPFALYTGMSSAISFVIGPLGFVVMGVMLYRSFKHVKSWDEAQTIFKESWKEMVNLARGDYDRATLAFKYIAASRIILEKNFAEEILSSQQKIQHERNLISELNVKMEIKQGEMASVQLNIDDCLHEADTIEEYIRRKKEELENINNKVIKLNEDILYLRNLQNSLNILNNLRQARIQSYETQSNKLRDRINKITTL